MFRSSAHVYDLVGEAMGKDYAAESVQLRQQIEDVRPGAQTLLDVACGTGAHLVHLTQWYDCTGLDLDAGMLAEARRRVPSVELVEADMRAFDLGRRFDAVVCLFSSIGYAGDVDGLDRAVGCMADHLEPGGALFFDGWIRPGDWIDPGIVDALSIERDGTAVARVSRSRREGTRTTLEMEYLVASADGFEHLVDRHELTLFTDDEYKRAFERAGLDVEIVESPFAERDRYRGIRPS